MKINYGPTQDCGSSEEFEYTESCKNSSVIHIYMYLENIVHSSLLSVFYKNQLHRRYSKKMCLIWFWISWLWLYWYLGQVILLLVGGAGVAALGTTHAQSLLGSCPLMLSPLPSHHTSRRGQNFPGGQKSPLLENHWLNSNLPKGLNPRISYKSHINTKIRQLETSSWKYLIFFCTTTND